MRASNTFVPLPTTKVKNPGRFWGFSNPRNRLEYITLIYYYQVTSKRSSYGSWKLRENWCQNNQEMELWLHLRESLGSSQVFVRADLSWEQSRALLFNNILLTNSSSSFKGFVNSNGPNHLFFWIARESFKSIKKKQAGSRAELFFSIISCWPTVAAVFKGFVNSNGPRSPIFLNRPRKF
jgi:hypothetical protein